MLICSSRRQFYCVIYYSNFWHTFVPYIFYLPETSLCSTGTLRASWRCDSIMSSYSSLHALQLACHVEQHLQQTRTPLLMLAASGVYASGWSPSVCPVDQLPLSGSDVQSVCRSSAVDRCRRQSAAAAIVIRCDPRDEDRDRLLFYQECVASYSVLRIFSGVRV